MLKGINKQIIEIKCPNDEFFEKALLFVKADKTDLPCSVINEHSSRFLAGYDVENDYDARKKDTSRTLKLVILFLMLALAAVLSACIWLVLKI